MLNILISSLIDADRNMRWRRIERLSSLAVFIILFLCVVFSVLLRFILCRNCVCVSVHFELNLLQLFMASSMQIFHHHHLLHLISFSTFMFKFLMTLRVLGNKCIWGDILVIEKLYLLKCFIALSYHFLSFPPFMIPKAYSYERM